MTVLFARRIGALALLAAAATPAQALVFYVGSGCDYADLQVAVDAAPASGTEIRLTKSLTGQHVNIDGKSLSIIGGFASCGAAAPTPGVSHTVSAGSHTDDSVLTVRGSVQVLLQNLVIADGKESGGGYGGGIDFIGRGGLVLSNVAVQNNRAGHGAGINVDPTGAASLTLQQGSYVYNNTATYSGAGIRLEGLARLYMTDGTGSISGNVISGTSDGHGGGLQVIGPAARADIGSGTISGNSARYGGGVSVEDAGVVRVFSSVAAHPSTISGNSASQTGGGVYLAAKDGEARKTALCGFGYALSGNTAQEGAAIYADTVGSFDNIYEGSLVNLALNSLGASNACGPESADTLGAVACTTDTPCNTIKDNRTQNSDGSLTDGATLLMQSDSPLYLERVAISGNRAGRVLRGFQGEHQMRDCLVRGNTVDHEVIATDEDGGFSLLRCTLADNVMLDASKVLSIDGPLTLFESILRQLGHVSSDDRPNSLMLRNVMSNEVASIGGARADVVLQTDPKFKNPEQGNYRLAPGSPAIDFAAVPPNTSLDGDLDNRPRSVDLPVPDRAGPLDLGAYELQSLAQFPPDETFDTVTVPALPDEWQSQGPVGFGKFYTVKNTDGSFVQNAVYTPDGSIISDTFLLSPRFTVVSKGRLTFLHRVDFEPKDGMALEIVIGSAPGQDILAAGGSFVSEGYNATMAGDANPLGTRAAWSGNSGGFRKVIVNLPPAADGQSVQLRWHMGTNAGVSGGGYWLDDVHVDVDTRVTDRLFCGNFDAVACQ